ncbi:hypothetical protein [Clostridium chrysemydis]|uniref:hypothetical protein n=1 Tax=Clostridium chrysemydis TaxID=2665504 RepID=UPI00188334D6|nr:hypothetical protein [Clostridium chrysemydis]
MDPEVTEILNEYFDAYNLFLIDLEIKAASFLAMANLYSININKINVGIILGEIDGTDINLFELSSQGQKISVIAIGIYAYTTYYRYIEIILMNMLLDKNINVDRYYTFHQCVMTSLIANIKMLELIEIFSKTQPNARSIP